MTTSPRACAECGEPLPPKARADARYCSTRCRASAHRRRRAGRAPRVKVAAAEPPPVRVTSLGWCVEGHVPAELEAALRRLHDDLYEQHGDEATEGLQLTREPGRGSAQIFVALHDFDIAVRFAQAVNALVEKTPREADDAA